MVPPDEKPTATLPAPETEPTPAWEVAYLFPYQGHWSEADYLALDTNRFVEFVDGTVEVLPMPNLSHQDIALFLCMALKAYLATHNVGRVVIAPFKVRLRAGKFREPDVTFMLRENADRIGQDFWDGADLVVEVVSEDDRRRDLVVKRDEYAQAGISEYWVVDPRDQRITVLTLQGAIYTTFGEFGRGDHAISVLLPGFEVDVTAALDAGR